MPPGRHPKLEPTISSAASRETRPPCRTSGTPDSLRAPPATTRTGVEATSWNTGRNAGPRCWFLARFVHYEEHTSTRRATHPQQGGTHEPRQQWAGEPPSFPERQRQLEARSVHHTNGSP